VLELLQFNVKSVFFNILLSQFWRELYLSDDDFKLCISSSQEIETKLRRRYTFRTQHSCSSFLHNWTVYFYEVRYLFIHFVAKVELRLLVQVRADARYAANIDFLDKVLCLLLSDLVAHSAACGLLDQCFVLKNHKFVEVFAVEYQTALSLVD